MRKLNLIFLSAIALAALLSYWTPRNTEPVSIPEAASQSPPTQQQAQTTTAVTSTIAIRPIAATRDSTEEEQPAAQDESHPWDVLPIEEPVATTEPLAELEEAYMTEAFDPDWAAPLEESFHSAFDAARLQDSTVEQAECRTTLCRFTITHKNSAAQDAFVLAFLQSRLLPLNQVTIAQHSQQTADGSIAAVYFLARNELAQVHN